MSDDKQSSSDDRTGQLFVYKDTNEVTKACMVGWDVTQEEYDLMPEYLQEQFDRPNDEYDEALQGRQSNVYIIPEEAVKQIEKQAIESKEATLITSSTSDEEKVAPTQESEV